MHASALVTGTKGILICGPSGAGKSSLAMALLEDAQNRRNFAALVSDDQTRLSSANGRLIAHCPDTLFGQVEIRGFGIARIVATPTAVIHLVVSLKSHEDIERMPEENSITVEGIVLPHVQVPRQNEQQAVRLITATLAK